MDDVRGAVADGGGGGAGGGGDEDAEFAEEGEGGDVGLREPGWLGGGG